MIMEQRAQRLAPTTEPRDWGFTDEELATHPTVYRPDLLKGKVYLVSGGGSGMGRGMAYLLARLGADVMICGRRAEKLEQTAAGIRRHLGREIGTHAMTIRDPEQVEALVAATFDRFGRLDTLVNNGGGQFPQAAIDFSIKGWNAVIDTNLNGTWYMMQAATRQWRDRKQPGSIINIVATIERGMPQVAHTCAARAGVIYLTKTVATEWAPLGIRVNCVAPGAVEIERTKLETPDYAGTWGALTPMRRVGQVQDIAEAVVFLANEKASFITGQTLYVDGGLFAQPPWPPTRVSRPKRWR